MAILVACLTAYGVSVVVSGRFIEIPADILLRLGGGFAPALADGEWWRLLTATFFHGGVLHLVVNQMVLLDVGPAVEAGFRQRRDSHGPVRLVGIFLLGAAVGFLASAWWTRDSVTIGASGGIFACYGFWLAEAPRRLVVAGGRRRWWPALVYVLVAFGAGFLIPGVDNAAHLGGLVAGGLIGAVAARWRSAMQVGVLALLASGIAMMPADWAIPYRSHQEFEQAYADFLARDRSANEAIRRALRDAGVNPRDGVRIADQVESSVYPVLRRNADEWRKAETRFRGGVFEKEATRWRHYSEYRLEAVTALSAAFRAVDPAKREAAIRRFDAAIDRARSIAEGAKLESDR